MASSDSDPPSPPFSLPPRKRPRSPSRSPTPPLNYDSDDDDGERLRESSSGGSEERGAKRRRFNLSVEVCRDFLKNSCLRTEIDCKFAHPHDNVSVESDRVTACADSLRNTCFRGRTCRYYHPPPHIKEHLRKDNDISDAKGEVVCKDYLRGRCLRRENECRFSHHTYLDQNVIVCQDFLRGRCERKACRYSHASEHESAQVQVCREFLRGKCERSTCRYLHVPTNEPHQVQVCLDFLRGRCERRTCKYSHDTTDTLVQIHHGTPVMFMDTGIRFETDKETVPVCNDFLKNKCSRDFCKYLHPGEQKEPGKITGSHPDTCRDFLRGDCHRTSCRFYHPSASK